MEDKQVQLMVLGAATKLSVLEQWAAKLGAVSVKRGDDECIEGCISMQEVARLAALGAKTELAVLKQLQLADQSGMRHH
jgi:hypothetical protein